MASSSKQTSTPRPGFGDLPQMAKDITTEDLVKLTPFDTVTSVARTIATLCCLSKDCRDFGRSLWPKLAAELEKPPPELSAADRCPPLHLRHENRFLGSSVTFSLGAPSEFEAGLFHAEYLEDVNVPDRVAAEVLRLRAVYMSQTKACSEFLLTKKELKDLPVFHMPDPLLGAMHLYRVVDVVERARKKYKSKWEVLEQMKRDQEEEERQQRAHRASSGYYAEQNRKKADRDVAKDAWVETHTEHKEMLEAATAAKSTKYLNNKERKKVKNEAVVKWVNERYEGDVDAACKGDEVQNSGDAKTVASMIRGLWRANKNQRDYAAMMEEFGG